MSSEVRIIDGGGDDDCRVTEWEAGLPNFADLPPLSQFLISPELASAFSITPEPHRSTIDVDRASRDTLSNLRTQSQHLMNKINDFRSGSEEEVVVEGEDTVDLTEDGSPDRKLRRVGEEDDDSMKTSKRIRLVWTPQLHKRSDSHALPTAYGAHVLPTAADSPKFSGWCLPSQVNIIKAMAAFEAKDSCLDGFAGLWEHYHMSLSFETSSTDLEQGWRVREPDDAIGEYVSCDGMGWD
ncbi:hypothetical protein E3N88_17560 [Mikania micrantha]|uniref:Uncharacterized protein n=1 Tax=Mikania micrantha TaxID=192012 RepID=A0A5N6NSR9_9ASTR|nr:hypothetical protein E3N88_17560 [Mikania micrantha]